MTPRMEVMSPIATTADAARKMKDLDVGEVPVCEREKPLSIGTDRDILLCVVAICSNLVQARVSEAMMPGLVFCYEDEEVEAAADLMVKKSICRAAKLPPESAHLLFCKSGELNTGGIAL